MAGKSIVIYKLRQILLQRMNGMGLQTISKTLDISRNTVKKYLRLVDAGGYKPTILLKMNDAALKVLLEKSDNVTAARSISLEELFPYFEQELRKGMNRRGLWKAYRRQYPDGYGFSQFCNRFKQWQTGQSIIAHRKKASAKGVAPVVPLRKVMIFEQESGKQIPAEIFIALQGYHLN